MITDCLEHVVRIFFAGYAHEYLQLKIVAFKDSTVKFYAAVAKYVLLAEEYYQKTSWGKGNCTWLSITSLTGCREVRQS
jgi:hypothetical protein